MQREIGSNYAVGAGNFGNNLGDAAQPKCDRSSRGQKKRRRAGGDVAIGNRVVIRQKIDSSIQRNRCAAVDETQLIDFFASDRDIGARCVDQAAIPRRARVGRECAQRIDNCTHKNIQAA